ncbi:MAG: hypothetical protein JXB13_01035 [Phycisphaerae bacterium]|nr:hypothetical protein [Phycisphaerae bacterium]
MDTAIHAEPEGSHVDALLRDCLSECQAINLDALSRKLGLSEARLARALQAMAERGEIEVLRPLVLEEKPGMGDGRRARLEHYRLIRETDSDYLWEQNVAVSSSWRRALHAGAGERRTAIVEEAYAEFRRMVPDSVFCTT